MPEDFLRCVREGGKVRTKNLKGNKYIRICFKNGKSYASEVKTKKDDSDNKNWVKNQLSKKGKDK